jgi:AcrR family transcriptional regulator
VGGIGTDPFWNNVITVLSQRDIVVTMTFGTTAEGYGDHFMATEPVPSRGDDTRRALLDAAHGLLATEGPGSLTVRRIAAAAGMSTMNVYSRFGGKDGVLDELFTDGFHRLGEAMREDPDSDDPLADLHRCSRTYRRFARENPTYYSLMFDRVVADFVPSEAAQAVAVGTLQQLQRRVERAIASGVIRDGDSFAIATALWACEHGLVSLEARTSEGQHMAFDWDRVYELTTEALLRGLA